MKKLIIIFLSLFLILSAQADERSQKEKCKSITKYTNHWYYNNCDGIILQSTDQKPDKSHLKKGKNNPWKGYPYNSGEIPEDAKPDEKILKHYLRKYISYSKLENRPGFKIKKSKNFKKFEFDLRKDEYVIKQLNKTALLSYLEYVNGKIVVDEITPKDRFGKIFKNNSKYVSNSMGKSIISYITGHAICRGYIAGINHKLNDWPILESTLYYDQPIINLLNMASGDYKYIKTKGGGEFKNSSRWVNEYSVQSFMKNEMKNTTPGKNKYHYSNLNTNLIGSYVLYKMGRKDFKKMLNEIFVDKVGIEYDMVIKQQPKAKLSQASLTYGMHVTRYDYLRIAVAMLDDWNNNTCEGQYLKSLFENRIKKGNVNNKNTREGFSHPKHYGGQFHIGISKKRDKPIFILDGFGGQNITIDFENNKIIAILSIHRDHNWMKLVHSKF